MAKIYQIKVTLKNIAPPVWRKILVESDTALYDLHKILQTTMGWSNAHLHQFVHRKKFYSNPVMEEEWIDDRQVDYTGVTIADLLKNEKQSMVYEYDFGDGWKHTIVIEKILPGIKGAKYPVCVAGKRNCPPEDCGGPLGYQDMLSILADQKHEEYKELKEWLGGPYDPEAFDLNKINLRLSKKDYGCIILD
jgi:hypothetical protein